MRTKFEIKKTILGNDLFVSENWVSNGVFAIRKLFVKNADDFYNEQIFNRLSIYKGVSGDFTKEDNDFEQWIKKNFIHKYLKTGVCIRELKKFFTVFESKTAKDEYKYILIDNEYVDYFNLDVLYGAELHDSIVFVDDTEQIDFFICDNDINFDKVIVKKFIDFGKSDSKSEKKMNKFFK